MHVHCTQSSFAYFHYLLHTMSQQNAQDILWEKTASCLWVFMFPKLWPSHDVWSTFCAWICCWVPWLPCYFKSCSSFTKRYCRLVKKEASFRCPTCYNWKRTIYDQEVRTSGCPAAAPPLRNHNRGRGTLKPQTLTVPAQHGSSSQAVPCWAPGPRAEREPSTASIRVTQLLNKLWIKERKEFCLHDNGKACAYISKSLLTSADLCLSWSGWRISARVHTTACSQHPPGPEPSRAIRAGHPPSLTRERWRQSKIKSFFRKYLQRSHPGSAQGPFGWLHAF